MILSVKTRLSPTIATLSKPRVEIARLAISSFVYSATCKLCTSNNVYVGKTVSCLSQRVNGHRSKFYEILRSFENDRSLSFQSPDSFDDENILGAHLFSVHNLKEKKEFNRCFCFDILLHFTRKPKKVRAILY